MPGVAAVVATVAAAGSAYVSYEQQKKADAARKQQAEAEQKLLDQQAAEAERQGEVEAQKIRDAADKMKGRQTAALAASGVKLFSGTAGDLLTETDRLSEFDALEAIKSSKSYAKQLRTKKGGISAPQYATSTLLKGAFDTASTGAVWGYQAWKSKQKPVT